MSRENHGDTDNIERKRERERERFLFFLLSKLRVQSLLRLNTRIADFFI